jgi:putative transposase
VGYRRIHGELALRGVAVAASKVWEILKTAGIEPSPQRATVTWAAFLRSKAEAILAMDWRTSAASRVRFLVRDRDGKYPGLIDEMLTGAGITTVLASVRAPRMNSIMERWVKTLRTELLDRVLIWNECHLRYALREYERHSLHRPHRSLAAAAPL